MKVTVCDLCGKRINDGTRASIEIDTGIAIEIKDFHIECAIRVVNKINNFCWEEKRRLEGDADCR